MLSCRSRSYGKLNRLVQGAANANLGVEAGKSDVLVACEGGVDGIFTIHRIGATYVVRRGLDLKIRILSRR